jgi:hypothetical protein
MNEAEQIVLDRISKGVCPICDKEMAENEYTYIENKNIKADDLIKVHSIHKKFND